MEHYVEDCKALVSQIKEQEKVLRLKRRWLMDLPLYESERKLMNKFNPLMDKTIPETLLREDDVNYDTIRSFVQRGFGVHNYVKEQQVQDNVQSLVSHNIFKNLSSLLDNMTNKGLYCFANMLTDGLVEFEETRWKMKKVIRECLPRFLNEESNSFCIRTKQISCLLKDPQYFHGNHDVLHPPTEFRTAAARVLDGLEELPLQTLSAMYRKLKGESGYIPVFGSYKTQQKRDLIGPVRNRCNRMLSKLHEGEEPQEPLVKAMVVAGLTLKLILSRSSVPEFQKFSPEIEFLQNNIAKAISLISPGNKVSCAEIEALHKKLQGWAESKVEFSKKKLRRTIRNLLIDFLFECGDMETIPECLTEAVLYINKRFDDSTCRRALQEEVEKEVEILLCVSAQTKQIVWDLLPGLEVDQDFATAYMEDSEGSDENEDEEGVYLARSFELCSDESKGLSESFDETNPFDSGSSSFVGNGDGISSHLSPNSQLNCKLESVHITEKDTSDSRDFTHYSSYPESKMLDNTKSFNGNEYQFASFEKIKQTNLHPILPTIKSESSSPLSPCRSKSGDCVMTQETVNGSARNAEFPHCSSPFRGITNLQYKQCTSGNKYLSVQRACDETSMAMYRIIGDMLEEFAQDQHLDLGPEDGSYLRSHSSDS